MRLTIILSCLVAFATCVFARGTELIDFALDPVALIAGHESPGKADLTIERGRFRYHFADANSRSLFEKEPERYEIQLGGACARMGPLNHAGQSDLHAVHDGKLYLFASENCRQTFVTNADSLLESDDPPPDVSDESIRRGRELLDLAVNAMGGAVRIDAIKTYHDKMYLAVGDDSNWNGVYIAFPDSVCEKHRRNEVWWSKTIAPDAAWFDSNEESAAMASSQQRAFQRGMSRLLLMIVKSRNLPTFICSYTGTGEIEGQPVEQIAVAFNGATNVLSIDPKTGKILGQTYRGRGPNAFLGEVEHVYSDHTTFDGITLPITWKTSFNGDYVAEYSGTLDEVHFNKEIDQKLFEAPKGK